MQARIPLNAVRRALRASSIEAQDCRFEGKRRRCAQVGLYMLRVGIPTLSTAVARA